MNTLYFAISTFVMFSYCGFATAQNQVAPRFNKLKHQFQTSELKFHCLDGETRSPFANPNTKAVALVFVAIDCPIANSYIPLINRIHSDFSGRGISILLVYPNREISSSKAKKHIAEFSITVPVVLDTDLEIAKLFGANVTPETVIISQSTRTKIYQGAIDNLYSNFGKKRRTATQNYLLDCLQAVSDGQAIPHTNKKSVGCFICFDE